MAIIKKDEEEEENHLSCRGISPCVVFMHRLYSGHVMLCVTCVTISRENVNQSEVQLQD